MIRIDAHHHIWDLSVRDQDWVTGEAMAPIRRDFSVADLAPHAKAAGIDRTVLVQTLAVPEETPELLAVAAREELVAGVVGWTDLTAPDAAEALARLRDLPGGERLVGIRHGVQGEPDENWLTRPEVLRGLRAVAAAGLAYDLLVLPHQLPAAVRAAEAVPEGRFVLDHLAKPRIAEGTGGAEWADGIRALAALPNTACKLSGMVTEARWHEWSVDDLRPYAQVVLDAFGPDQVMFGSDWPVVNLASDYGRWAEAAEQLTDGLTRAERESVRGGAAVRAYRLDQRAAQGL